MRLFLVLLPIVYAYNATYNSFVKQVGYCKLQGFRTTNRSTSNSVPMFMDNRVRFGVGLSDAEFQGDCSNCGRCIQIANIDNLAVLNDELDHYLHRQTTVSNVTVMVMDECTDAICTSGFLDLDVYTQHPPVSHGNPYNVQWTFIPCPVYDDEYIELLFCLSDACNALSPIHTSITSVIAKSNRYHWSVYVRNARLPVSTLYLSDYDVYLEKQNGWIWNHGPFSWNDTFEVVMDGKWKTEINLLKDGILLEDYHSGILVKTNFQN